MSVRDLVETYAIVAMPLDGQLDSVVDRFAECLFLAETRAGEIVDDELPEPPLERDPPGASIDFVDEAGHAIAGVRLEREPGTTRFTIVLTTTEQEAS